MTTPLSPITGWDHLQIWNPEYSSDDVGLGRVQESATLYRLPCVVVFDIIWFERRWCQAWKVRVYKKSAMFDFRLHKG